MKLIYYFCITILIVIILSNASCPVGESNEIYVCTTGIDNGKACYWMNNSQTFLSSVTSLANAIYVDNNYNIYIAGADTNGSNLQACYWYNRSIIFLNAGGAVSSEAAALTTSNDTLYIAGKYNNGAKDIACYWKDGTLVTLDSEDSVAYDIYIDGNTIYIAGYYKIGPMLAACYWRDDNGDGIGITKTDLYLKNNSTAYSLLKMNSRIYAAGYYANNSSEDTACYWKDNSTDRTDLPGYKAQVSDMFYSNGRLVMAGYILSKSFPTPPYSCYWLNDVSNDLSNSYPSKANTVYIFEDVIYNAGLINKGSVNIPCYWENNTLHELSHTGPAEIKGIFVVRF